MKRLSLVVRLVALALAGAGCEQRPEPPPAEALAESPASTNRIDIPPPVRQNLGLTFARVESRPVARTLRVPGRFELMPTARREYRVPAAGRVELLVRQFDRIEVGTPLYRLDAAHWRDLQRELTDAEASVRSAEAATESIGPLLEAHEQHHAELQSAVDVWTQRVAALERLQAAGGARGEDISQARAALGGARSDLAETLEKEAELTARGLEGRAQLEAAESRRAILIEAAASLTGIPAERLASESGGSPIWRSIRQIEVAALSPGVIERLNAVNGSLVDQGEAVLSTVQPEHVRFRAHALQSDLGRLADGLQASVVAPRGGSLDAAASIAGTLALAPTADPERRTIEVLMTPRGGSPLPPWARAGVSGFLEIIVAGRESNELAIPLACVAHDGTQRIIFRRDPANPDKAIRMEADLGMDDGRWIVIESGVAEGNEIVLDGVYQLMVATSGSITKGGHFHPDGTFHEGDE